jgi:hypothetical protein
LVEILGPIVENLKILGYIFTWNVPVTKRHTGELKIAGPNPDISHVSLWDNIYPIRINNEAEVRIGKNYNKPDFSTVAGSNPVNGTFFFFY